MPPSNVPETITENVSEKKGSRGKIRLGNAGFLGPPRRARAGEKPVRSGSPWCLSRLSENGTLSSPGSLLPRSA